MRMINLLIVIFTLISTTYGSCLGLHDIELQTLGTGGPIADGNRASSANLIWINGKARILVDAGGGAFLRYGDSGAKFQDLDLIALTHFHTDHSADFITLLKSGYFTSRTRTLIVSGPNGSKWFPSLKQYVSRLLNPKNGAYRYLSEYLTGDGVAKLTLKQVNTRKSKPTIIYNRKGTKISALGVPHGRIPALAYKIEIRGKSIVFAGDQNGSSKAFIQFAKGADILVVNFAIPQNAGKVAKYLHATPKRIGEIAHNAKVKQLILTHLMKRSLNNLDQNLNLVKLSYNGSVLVAKDLDCFAPVI